MDDFLAALGANLARAREQGLRYPADQYLAWLQQRLSVWPSAWGDTLEVWLYGGIQVERDLEIPAYRIRIEGKNLAGNPTGEHPLPFDPVHRCSIVVDSKDLSGFLDALGRLEEFLGAWFVSSTAGSSVGSAPAGGSIHYWCMFLSNGSATIATLPKDLDAALRFAAGVRGYHAKVQNLIQRAAWWVRQSAQSFMSGQLDPSVFLPYMAYWNAFECLVDAVHKQQPFVKPTAKQKDEKIEVFFDKLGHPPRAKDVAECYHSIVNPGFRSKAEQALVHVFGLALGSQYSAECFAATPPETSLYRIRNDIDHGNIVEFDADQRLRVRRGLYRLETIVLRLFYAIGLDQPGYDPEDRTRGSGT